MRPRRGGAMRGCYYVRLLLLLWMARLFSVDAMVVVEGVEEKAGEEPTKETVANDGQENDSGANTVFWEDDVENSFLDAVQADPDCSTDEAIDGSCWNPPSSTIEEERRITRDASCSFGGPDPDQDVCEEFETVVDKHWGSDPNILAMRNKLRESGSGVSRENRRPPVFLMPGLASTRLVAWRYKACPQHPLLSDIKVLDNVWLNINLVMQMGTIDVSCMKECISLGLNQTDTDDLERGCKLRPDEGLDAISSLSPGGIGSNLLVGGTNTVYSWLIQWLADNLGYDVGSMVGLPYDWRLSPDKMEERDGFFTLTRSRVEAAVSSNGAPGIFVAHSMGNLTFRYFLLWLRTQLRKEAYESLLDHARRRADVAKLKNANSEDPFQGVTGWVKSLAGVEDNIAAGENNPEKEKEVQDGFWEIAKEEGDINWRKWIDRHIWTYVGLSAPMLGAVNPLRSVISGENMGLPVTDSQARVMEISFGSTHTVNPVSMKNAFCDEWEFSDWGEEKQMRQSQPDYRSHLACLDDIATEIDNTEQGWDNIPALKALLRERMDWDSRHPMIEVIEEECEHKEKSPCRNITSQNFSPRDVETGDLFTRMSEIWKEKGDPLKVKRDQLRESFWDAGLPNILNMTWDRPPIKHVIMAYGVDLPTEVSYTYRKRSTATKRDSGKANEFDGMPELVKALWETSGGVLTEQKIDSARGGLADLITMKKLKRVPVGRTGLVHSGDGSCPYLSLSYVHTWLLHAMRARAHESNEHLSAQQILDMITISHRPTGGTEWLDGFALHSSEVKGEDDKRENSDTGTDHPHGTKYKPEMLRYHTVGTSRATGRNYSTTVIEAIGVEHKETTRNYDILAAVFTDVLRRMHDDFDFI